jgi:putative component of membrane protein insertase Oxa1/YidC/SpoIIIJ protein YidD
MKTIAIIFFVILPFKCMAQNKEDLKRFENLFAENTHKHKWGEQLKDNRNELSFIFSTVFVIYKEILSSQDIDACVFTPSCSVYAVESIKKEGVIKGYFNAIDRLTRCNPGPKKDMPIDLSTGKYFDPVEPDPSVQKYHTVSQSPSIPVDK